MTLYCCIIARIVSDCKEGIDGPGFFCRFFFANERKCAIIEQERG